MIQIKIMGMINNMFCNLQLKKDFVYLIKKYFILNYFDLFFFKIIDVVQYMNVNFWFIVNIYFIYLICFL